MRIDENERSLFVELCTLILPAWEYMPDAGALGLEKTELEKVCRASPDLESGLLRIFRSLKSPVLDSDLQSMRISSANDLHILITTVCGAYYLHPSVKKALRYGGQQPLGLPRGGFGGEDLVLKMMGKPKLFRVCPD